MRALCMTATANNTVLDRFLAWCLDIGSALGSRNTAFAYEVTNAPFSNSEGLNATQMTRVQNVFNANYGTLDATVGVQAAGFQVALWNELYDTDADAGSGDFKKQIVTATPVPLPVSLVADRFA